MKRIVLTIIAVVMSTISITAQNTRKQIATAEEEVKKPYPKEEEYKQKSARLAELTAELSIESKKTTNRDQQEQGEER